MLSASYLVIITCFWLRELETWYLQDLLPFGIPDHWWVIYFLTLCNKSILVPVCMHSNHVQDQSKVSAYPAEELRIQPVKWWSPWEGRPANKQRGSIASCTLVQHLGRSGKLSFFIIYKFWQNCASVRQVSDPIEDCKTIIFHVGHLNICDYFFKKSILIFQSGLTEQRRGGGMKSREERRWRRAAKEESGGGEREEERWREWRVIGGCFTQLPSMIWISIPHFHWDLGMLRYGSSLCCQNYLLSQSPLL